MTKELKITEKGTTASAGFTMIELVVTMVIAAILIAAAAPSFRSLLQSNRLTTSVNELSGSINMARSEAVKRGYPVVICKSNNGTSCVTTGDWGQGWIIFKDVDDDGVYTAPSNLAFILETEDELIRDKEGVEGNVALVGSGNVANYISYKPEGRAQLISGGASQTGTITACLSCTDLCQQDPPWNGRDLQLTFPGRLQIDGGTCTCSC